MRMLTSFSPERRPAVSGSRFRAVDFLHWPAPATGNIFLRHFIAIVSSTTDTSRKGLKDELQEADDEDVPVGVVPWGHTLRSDSRRLHGLTPNSQTAEILTAPR